MKKAAIIGMIFLSTIIQAQAQNDGISRFFSKYENDMDFTVVNITGRMFGMFTNIEVESPEDKELLNSISKLTGLKILSRNDAENGHALYKEAFNLIPQKEYDELMTIRDQDKNMRFLIKEKAGKISELLMIIGGEHEFFIMSIVGEIDLKQISRLSKAMDIDGLDKLDKLEDKTH